MTLVPPDTAPEIAALARAIGAEFPRFRLVAKERSAFMRAIAAVMPWNRRFLDGYTTTIGYSVYMPCDVRCDGANGPRVLRHERVHLEQFRAHPIWFPLSYLLLLPAGFTMRARWEFEAYVESMRAELEETGGIADDTIDRIARQFTGPDYLYMDVRRNAVRRKLEAARLALTR